MFYRDGALSLEERLASLARERERLESELARLEHAIADAEVVDARRRSFVSRLLESVERGYRGLTPRVVALVFLVAMSMVLGTGLLSAFHVRDRAREKLRREMITDQLHRGAGALESACLDGASAGLDATVSIAVTKSGSVERARVRTRSRSLDDESTGRNECLEGALRARTFEPGRHPLSIATTLRLAPRRGGAP